MNRINLAGLLYFLASVIILSSIITADAFFPKEQNIFATDLMNMGESVQETGVSYRPYSTIFNIIILVAGAMILSATFLLRKDFKQALLAVTGFGFGLGLVGLGFFPGKMIPYHNITAMVTLIAGSIFSISTFKIVSSPFKYISLLFGSVALITWSVAVFAPTSLFYFINMGGTERWVAYPIMLWLAGFGGYLMHTKQTELNIHSKKPT